MISVKKLILIAKQIELGKAWLSKRSVFIKSFDSLLFKFSAFAAIN